MYGPRAASPGRASPSVCSNHLALRICSPVLPCIFIPLAPCPKGASPMAHIRSGILEVIPGSRIIQFYGDADHAVATLRQYGELITSFSNDGPHALRVDPLLDFATTVVTVETQLTLLPLK